MDTNSLIPFLETLLDQSGAVIAPYFFNRDFSVEEKADASPVTRADREGGKKRVSP